MPYFEVTFEVFCARCGAGLCNQSDTRTSYNRREPQVTVEPCEQCLSAADDKGYERGFEEARNQFEEK